MPHAFPAQRAENGGPGIPRARRVNQHSHFHAAAGGLAERPREGQADFVPVKDIGAERDGLAGLLDGLQHRREGFVAVYERLDPVARQQGTLDHPTHHPREHIEVAGVAGQMAVQFLRRTRGLRLMSAVAFEAAPQQDGLAAEPVDPKNEVEHRPCQGHQPDEAHPGDSRARIPLVKDGVSRGHERDEQRESSKKDMPGWMRQNPHICG